MEQSSHTSSSSNAVAIPTEPPQVEWPSTTPTQAERRLLFAASTFGSINRLLKRQPHLKAAETKLHQDTLAAQLASAACDYSEAVSNAVRERN